MGSTRLATVVTRVNLIGSLEHANRLIFYTKGHFEHTRIHPLNKDLMSNTEGTGLPSGAEISITPLLTNSALLHKAIICYLELDMHFLITYNHGTNSRGRMKV